MIAHVKLVYVSLLNAFEQSSKTTYSYSMTTTVSNVLGREPCCRSMSKLQRESEPILCFSR